MGRLDGKVIVLSAAAQGIGRAAAIVMNTPQPKTSVLLACVVVFCFCLKLCVCVIFTAFIIFIGHNEAFSILGTHEGVIIAHTVQSFVHHRVVVQKQPF